MPLLTYRCPKCEAKTQLIVKPEFVKVERWCPKDGALLEREARMGSTQTKELYDNGLMARRVEVDKKA